MCQDHPEIDEILDKNGAIGKFDPSSFEAMESLCNSYNKAVEKSLDKKVCKLVYLRSIYFFFDVQTGEIFLLKGKIFNLFYGPLFD
mgnify:CR=1 FL=1